MSPRTRKKTNTNQQQGQVTPYRSTRNSSRHRSVDSSTRQTEARDVTSNTTESPQSARARKEPKDQSSKSLSPSVEGSKTAHDRSKQNENVSLSKTPQDDGLSSNDDDPKAAVADEEENNPPSQPLFNDEERVQSDQLHTNTSQSHKFCFEGEGIFSIRYPVPSHRTTALEPDIRHHHHNITSTSSSKRDNEDGTRDFIHILKRFKSDVGCIYSNMDETVKAVEIMSRGNKQNRSDDQEPGEPMTKRHHGVRIIDHNDQGQYEKYVQKKELELRVNNIQDKIREGEKILHTLQREYRALENKHENIMKYICMHDNLARNAEIITLSYKLQETIGKCMLDLSESSKELYAETNRVRDIFLEEASNDEIKAKALLEEEK
ncbi:hypothetical protein BDA99DRAFT_589167 [Phascolomyces articulosus]|uniref:Uncharacterized protein n=1 Tax=Phascolomyces articulosus TaxID=60185 RepID=A0AAD5JRX8_9FUNG|nr:hypothetical protein BDA99DRAFT_589167 [Phascolomyces articulosus]